MFLGQMPRRPSKESAYKELKANLAVMGVWVAVLRVTPYVLHYLTREKQELKLEF